MGSMNFKQLKERFDIADFVADHLARTASGGYECPHCGSGTGPKGTGALYPMPDGEHYYCHSCGATGDAYDLAGALKGLETLDNAIGGLPKGLAVLGAASSLGKTALCLQIAAHLAASGRSSCSP